MNATEYKSIHYWENSISLTVIGNVHLYMYVLVIYILTRTITSLFQNILIISKQIGTS